MDKRAEYFKQYELKLQKFNDRRRTQSIETLMGVSTSRPSTSRSVSRFKTKDEIQRHLHSLFTRNQADTTEAQNLVRKVNLQLQDRPLQKALVRGLLKDKKIQTTTKIQPPILKPQGEQTGLTNSRIFSMISGQFSKYGPARSMAAITAVTLFKNGTPSQKKMVHKNEVKPIIEGTLKQIKQSPRRILSASPSRSSSVRDFLSNLSDINTLNIQKPVLQDQLSTSRMFQSSVMSYDHRTYSSQPKNKSQQEIQIPVVTVPPKRSQSQYQFNPFNNPTALQEYIHHWNPIKQYERDALRSFLCNKWIDMVIKTKSLQVELPLNMRSTPKITPLEIPEQNMNLPSPISTIKTQRSAFAKRDQNNSNTINEYMSEKTKKYKGTAEKQKYKTAVYEQKHWEMVKKYDDENLAAFDPFYERKIKIRRFKAKLRFYLVRFSRMKIRSEKIVDFIKKHSMVSYENIGAFSFITYLKSERYTECSNLLSKNPNLINDFNFLGDTPLHISVRRNNVSMLQYVLSHNPNLEMENMARQTALQLAMHLKHSEMVKLLLLCSANPWKTLCRNRDIKVACYCWIKLKCPSIYKKQQETDEEFSNRVFTELQWYLLSPRSDEQQLHQIYNDGV